MSFREWIPKPEAEEGRSASWTRRRMILALVAGALSGALAAIACSVPALCWLGWIALVPLLLVLPQERGRNSALVGLVSGASMAAVMLHWVPLAVAAMGGSWLGGASALTALAVCWGGQVAAFAWAISWLRKRLRKSLSARAMTVVTLVVTPALWIALEYTFTSWCAWASVICYIALGCSQWPLPVMIQSAAWGGMYGLSFMLVLFSAGIALAVGKRKPWVLAISTGAALLFVLAGWWRLSRNAAGSGDRPVRVALLQANVRSIRNIDKQAAGYVANCHLKLLPEIRKARPELVVWSEGAVPWVIREDDDLVRCMITGLRPLEPCHLVGAISEAPPGSEAAIGAPAYVLLPDGRITDQYYKTRPVLFAETGPRSLGKWLRVRLSTVGEKGLVGAGHRLEPLRSPVGTVGVVICNEILYPDMGRTLVRKGAEIMANMANGVRLKSRWARNQLFGVSVLRAVETGRDTMVANNSGISGVIDAFGRVKVRSEPLDRVCLAADVHRREGRTAYVSGGDWFAWTCLLGCLAAFACAWGRPRLTAWARR